MCEITIQLNANVKQMLTMLIGNGKEYMLSRFYLKSIIFP